MISNSMLRYWRHPKTSCKKSHDQLFQIVLITSRVWFPLLGPRTASVAMGLHVWCVSCKRLRQEALLIGFACSYTICIAVTHGRTGQINCKQSDVAATSTPIIDAGWKHNKVRIADLSSLVMLFVQVFFRAWSGLVKNMKKASLERNQSTHPRKNPPNFKKVCLENFTDVYAFSWFRHRLRTCRLHDLGVCSWPQWIYVTTA